MVERALRKPRRRAPSAPAMNVVRSCRRVTSIKPDMTRWAVECDLTRPFAISAKELDAIEAYLSPGLDEILACLR